MTLETVEKHLYRLVVQLGLQFLGICNLAHSFHEVLLSDVLTVRTDGKQTYRQTQNTYILDS